MGSTPRCDPNRLLINFKDEALKTVNGFKEVKSVVCIVSDGEYSSACIGSE